MKWDFIILGAHGLIFFGQIKNKTSPKFPTIQYLEAHMIITVMRVRVCNSVSGIALAICSQSKGELNSYSFC